MKCNNRARRSTFTFALPLWGCRVLFNCPSLAKHYGCPSFAITKDRAMNILLCGFLGLCANVALKCLQRSETAESGEMPIFNFNSDCQAALHRGHINFQCLGVSISPLPQHLIVSDFGEERRDQEETRYSKETLPLSSMFQLVYRMHS